MTPFRFHVPALPHLATSKINCACAYTIKVMNFCKMMTSLGHTVYHYGAEGSEVDCTEHVQIISKAEQDALLGPYDYKTQLPNHLKFDPVEPAWQLHNRRALEEILKRKQPKDFICLIAGLCQQSIANGVGLDVPVVEYGIGYGGCFAPFRCYESYAHAAKCYGVQQGDDPNGSFYHAVIPNYYDPTDFPYIPEKPGDYLLFVGRLIGRKGLEVAVEIAKEVKRPLYVCGQGAREYVPTLDGKPARLVADDGQVFESEWLQYLGHVDVQARARLMRGAKALLVPTLYLEPFGGVNVEAQLCGTPVITSDWGAFPETVEHGVTGWRCRTLEQFVWAARHTDELDREHIWRRAHKRWSIYRVRHMFQEYFQMVYDVYDSQGWAKLRHGRSDLDWLRA